MRTERRNSGRAMGRWALVLAAAGLVALGALGCREARTEDAPVHLNPNMDDQKYLEAQDPAEIEVDGYRPWGDHRALRPQVEGTVAAPCPEQSRAIATALGNPAAAQIVLAARVGDESGACDGLRSDTGYYTGKNADGSYVVSLPEGLEVTRRFVERGKERYGIFCSTCHGLSGDGNGTAVARGMTPPPSYHDQTRRSYEIGRIYEMIAIGGDAMPALGAQVPVADRWAIATYVRSLQFSHNRTLAKLPPENQDSVRKSVMGTRDGQRTGISIDAKIQSAWDKLGVSPAPEGGQQ